MSISEFTKFINNNFEKFSDSDVSYLKQLIEKDSRTGLLTAFNKILKQRNALNEELLRVKKLYDFEYSIASKPGSIILGLDEVGRGPLAGPLTVGAVILKRDPMIMWLNDSKQINKNKRKKISTDIKNNCIAWKTFSIPPKYIDSLGMTECLKRSFTNVVKSVEEDGINIDIILLDGNPLRFDNREVNVIKGDAKCASIAAASIIAKVERDQYMDDIAKNYPEYDFSSNKGYGTAKHIEAIKNYGLTPVHRKSFCRSFMQLSFF